MGARAPRATTGGACCGPAVAWWCGSGCLGGRADGRTPRAYTLARSRAHTHAQARARLRVLGVGGARARKRTPSLTVGPPPERYRGRVALLRDEGRVPSPDVHRSLFARTPPLYTSSCTLYIVYIHTHVELPPVDTDCAAAAVARRLKAIYFHNTTCNTPPPPPRVLSFRRNYTHSPRPI